MQVYCEVYVSYKPDIFLSGCIRFCIYVYKIDIYFLVAAQFAVNLTADNDEKAAASDSEKLRMMMMGHGVDDDDDDNEDDDDEDDDDDDDEKMVVKSLDLGQA